MTTGSMKSLLVAVFSVSILFISNASRAQEKGKEDGQVNEQSEGQKKGKKALDPSKIILEHIADGHDFHFAIVKGVHVSIPLPVILYSSGKGFSVFMSSAFHHGREVHDGYRLLEESYVEAHDLEKEKNAKGQPLFKEGKIYAVNAEGMPQADIAVYDF